MKNSVLFKLLSGVIVASALAACSDQPGGTTAGKAAAAKPMPGARPFKAEVPEAPDPEKVKALAAAQEKARAKEEAKQQNADKKQEKDAPAEVKDASKDSK